MGFSILPPAEDEIDAGAEREESSPGSDVSMSDSDVGSDSERPTKRPRRSKGGSAQQIVVPGEMITSETQWMRLANTPIVSTDDPRVFANHSI